MRIYYEGAVYGQSEMRTLRDVGIVVDDLAAAKAFFVELGLEQVGEADVAGE